GELRQCLLIHRIKSGIESMPVDDVLWMATRGGAQILGRDDVGSIEVGKAADIILIDTKKLGYAGGMHDPVATLLFSGNSHIVDTTIVNGKILVQDGKLLNLDEASIWEMWDVGCGMWDITSAVGPTSFMTLSSM
ncbi:unnamed protein product, partial [marine sediment metagenome]